MLCSNEGRLTFGETGVRLEVQPSPHELFLTREDTLAHRDWLVDMKSRFKTHKSRLKKVVRTFGPDEFEWIRPPAPRRPR